MTAQPQTWTPNPGDVVRAKGTLDGSTTLAEAAERAEALAADLRRLHAEGWTFDGPVNDDYGFLVSPTGERGDAEDD